MTDETPIVETTEEVVVAEPEEGTPVVPETPEA